MNNSFNLSDGIVTFKGDLDPFEKDIQKAEKKVESLKKSLMTGEFRMAASAAAAINREFEKSAKAAKRIMDEAKFGKLGLMIREASLGLNRFQAQATAFGTAGVAAGAGAIGLASAASPLAADTLTGSVKLFSAIVGRDFIPLVAELSMTIQKAARWWEGLDQSIKDTTVQVVKMTAMAGAAALALVGVIKVLSFIKAHPIMTVAGIGAATGEFINQRNNAAGAKQFAGAQADINGIAWKDVLNDGRMAQLKAMGPAGLAEAERDWRQRKKDYELAATESNNYQKGWFGGGGWKAGVQRNNDWDGSTQKGLIEAATRAQAEFTKSEMRWKGLAGEGKEGTVGDSRTKQDAASKDRLLLGSFGQSSYSSLADFYRSFNVAATSGSELESETLKKQREGNETLLNIAQTLEAIKVNTGRVQ